MHVNVLYYDVCNDRMCAKGLTRCKHKKILVKTVFENFLRERTCLVVVIFFFFLEIMFP